MAEGENQSLLLDNASLDALCNVVSIITSYNIRSKKEWKKLKIIHKWMIVTIKNTQREHKLNMNHNNPQRCHKVN